MQNIDNELRKHKFIIFGSDHYNTLGAVRSLGEAGIIPDVILHPKYSDTPHLTNNSKYVGKVFIVNSVEDGYTCLQVNYGNEDLKPFVYSCDDWVESCLDTHYDEIIDKFYFFHGAGQGIVTHYMDKDSISKLGEECGFNIPKAERLKRGELPKTLRYPIITKSMMSIEGGWKKDVHICYTEDELLKAYKEIQSEDVLVEEFIEKETEFCYDAFAINGGEDVVMPFRATYIRSLVGSYGNYILYTKTQEKDIVDKVKKMLLKVGFTGIFEAEFLLAKDGTVYFLEINFRNSTWSYPMTFGGVNMLYYWAKGTLSGQLDTEYPFKYEKFKGMVEPRDFKDSVVTGNVSIFTWLYQLLTTDCLFYWNVKDMRPVWAHFKHLVKKVIEKIF